MALDYHAVKYIKKLDLTGKKVLMLGRQHDRTIIAGKFAEHRFLQQGAIQVDSMDIDKSEGANVIWDLNEPIKYIELLRCYDLIWDGGTLEHVFNIPIALKNIRDMLKLNGIFISQQNTVIAGHGYYSLCPELFFKWAGCNGFTDSKCWSYPLTRLGRFFKLKEVRWENKRIEWSIFPRMFIFSSTKTSYDTSKMPLQCYPPVCNSNLVYWIKTLFPGFFNKDIPLITQHEKTTN